MNESRAWRDAVPGPSSGGDEAGAGFGHGWSAPELPPPRIRAADKIGRGLDGLGAEEADRSAAGLPEP